MLYPMRLFWVVQSFTLVRSPTLRFSSGIKDSIQFICKRTDRTSNISIGPLFYEVPSCWPLVVERIYQCCQVFIRRIHPKGKPICGSLSISEVAKHRNILSDWIIVEPFSGRFYMLWTVFVENVVLERVAVSSHFYTVRGADKPTYFTWTTSRTRCTALSESE